MKRDPDVVFAIDEGFGSRLEVSVTGAPEACSVVLYDPDRDACISIDCDIWARVVRCANDRIGDKA